MKPKQSNTAKPTLRNLKGGLEFDARDEIIVCIKHLHSHDFSCIAKWLHTCASRARARHRHLQHKSQDYQIKNHTQNKGHHSHSSLRTSRANAKIWAFHIVLFLAKTNLKMIVA